MILQPLGGVQAFGFVVFWSQVYQLLADHVTLRSPLCISVSDSPVVIVLAALYLVSQTL